MYKQIYIYIYIGYPSDLCVLRWSICHTHFSNFSRFIKAYIKKCNALQVHSTLTFSIFLSLLYRAMLLSLFNCQYLNPIQDRPFRGRSRMGERGAKRLPLPKMSHTYLAMMRLGTVIPCLKKILCNERSYHNLDFTRI